MSDSDWDDDYYPNMPRPRFRSPLRHAQRKITKSEVQPVDDEGQYEKKSRTVKVLHVGHSTRFEHTGDIFTSCTVALIKGYKFNIIVDTMNAWDGAKLENILLDNHIHPDEIHYVVCTNSNAIRTGCNYLFRDAFHIVGNSMNHGERHVGTPLDKGEEFLIEPKIKVVCTPGHTADGVSVLVTTDLGLIAITGDLFEREDDIKHPHLWRSQSQDPRQQEESRRKIVQLADYIVPGHGPMFQNVYKKYIFQD